MRPSIALADVGRDAAQAPDPERVVALPREEHAPVRRLELRDGLEVVIDGLANGQSEAVARLVLVIAPGEVLEPQALDVGKVRRDRGDADVVDWVGQGWPPGLIGRVGACGPRQTGGEQRDQRPVRSSPRIQDGSAPPLW